MKTKRGERQLIIFNPCMIDLRFLGQINLLKKALFRKMFCKNGCELIRWGYKHKYAFLLFNMIPSKLVPSLNAFIPRMNYHIFGEVCGGSVIAYYMDNSKINIVITHLMFHLNNLQITATRNNIFHLSCR